MMNRLLFILLIGFIISCDSPSKMGKKPDESYPKDQKRLPQGNQDPESHLNSLDFVLGDKMINEGALVLRENNYSDFTRVLTKDLEENSLLYDVAVIGDGFFVVNQKKQYSHARRFSALLKSRNEKVEKYIVVNDFQIIDQKKDKDGITILYGNFGHYNKFWETNNEVRLTRYDNELNQVWRFTPKSDPFPLEGIKIVSQSEQTTIQVNVIIGCHMCGYTIELGIDDLGKCISLCEVQRNQPPEDLDKKLIVDMFTNSTHHINYSLCPR